MARSAIKDSLDKFRFRVSVVNIDWNAVNDIANRISNNIGKRSESKSGFSEVVLPKVNVKTIEYRENLDGPKFIKVAGLSRFEPVSLRRGVTKSQELYEWYKSVADHAGSFYSSSSLISSLNFPPPQSPNYRKDILIEALDREGRTYKQWLLFEAFPIGYKGGNDLDANTSEKLIEEITIDYESFLEFNAETTSQVFALLRQEAARAAALQTAAGASQILNKAAEGVLSIF